eukprot:3563250-Pleurochrysis_carterae.AAC.2
MEEKTPSRKKKRSKRNLSAKAKYGRGGLMGRRRRGGGRRERRGTGREMEREDGKEQSDESGRDTKKQNEAMLDPKLGQWQHAVS